MSYRKDVIPLPPDFPLDVFEVSGLPDSRGSVALHFHDCMEIDFVLEGSGENHVETTCLPMECGDIHVINNLERHMASSTQGLKLLVVVFDASILAGTDPRGMAYLRPFTGRGAGFVNRIAGTDPGSVRLQEILRELQQEWKVRGEGYHLVARALLMHLLALLCRHYLREDSLDDSRNQFRRAYDRIREAVHYIHLHYHEPVSLDTLAGIVRMNRSYFSSSFSHVMGKTVTQYVDMLRLTQAGMLLKTTDMPVTEVAAAAGFANLSFFNRRFRAVFGQTPVQYRSGSKTQTQYQ